MATRVFRDAGVKLSNFFGTFRGVLKAEVFRAWMPGLSENGSRTGRTSPEAEGRAFSLTEREFAFLELRFVDFEADRLGRRFLGSEAMAVSLESGSILRDHD